MASRPRKRTAHGHPLWLARACRGVVGERVDRCQPRHSVRLHPSHARRRGPPLGPPLARCEFTTQQRGRHFDCGLCRLHSLALCSPQRGTRRDATRVLVAAGSDLEARSYEKGCTPLHVAAAGGYLEVMKVLIKAGATPSNRGIEGSKPMYSSAAFNGRVKVVTELLRAKADPGWPGPSGLRS